jgi:hypothetical protein
MIYLNKDINKKLLGKEEFNDLRNLESKPSQPRGTLALRLHYMNESLLRLLCMNANLPATPHHTVRTRLFISQPLLSRSMVKPHTPRRYRQEKLEFWLTCSSSTHPPSRGLSSPAQSGAHRHRRDMHMRSRQRGADCSYTGVSAMVSGEGWDACNNLNLKTLTIMIWTAETESNLRHGPAGRKKTELLYKKNTCSVVHDHIAY